MASFGVDTAMVVTCNPNPIGRASSLSITCVAEPRIQGQTLEVESWKYVTTGGELVTRMTNVTSATWSGRIAAPGTVLVAGKVNGIAASAERPVPVVARNWADKRPGGFPEDHGVHGRLDDDGQVILPLLPTGPGHLGSADPVLPSRTDFDQYIDVIEDGGPNHEIQYLTDIPWRTETEVYINYDALTVGSAFYNIQPRKDRTVHGVKYCGQPKVVPVRPFIEAHEGKDPLNQPLSHIGLYLNEVWRLSGPATESVTGKSSTLDFLPAKNSVDGQAIARALLADQPPPAGYLVNYGCRFNYDPNNIP